MKRRSFFAHLVACFGAVAISPQPEPPTISFRFDSNDLLEVEDGDYTLLGENLIEIIETSERMANVR